MNSHNGKQISCNCTLKKETQSSSFSKYKLIFIFFILITVLLSLSLSFIKDPSSSANPKRQNEIKGQIQSKIGKIVWKGNVIFSADTLNKVFGLKAGDIVDYTEIKRRLNNNVALLYLDNGFVYYKADFSEKMNKGEVDLIVTIFEGKVCKIGTIFIKGNVKVPSKEILKNIVIKSGDYFSKTKIISSARGIEAMLKFKPGENLMPKTILNNEKSTNNYAIIDLVFEVSEIPIKR